MRRHVALTRRIRALDPRKDSAELAEGRLRDFVERIRELIRLRDRAPESIPGLEGIITISLKLLQAKREQFHLPVIHSEIDSDDDLEEGGTGVPSSVGGGPLSTCGSGARLFSESDEVNDW